MFDEEIGIARKCNLCYDRVTKGLYPACADNVCLAHCIYFGDPEEIEAAIAEKKRPGPIAPRRGWVSSAVVKPFRFLSIYFCNWLD
ncbi:MAG: 4Fe-4S dicluster domain-containing protein [Deltaproteobacteria bacterium]